VALICVARLPDDLPGFESPETESYTHGLFPFPFSVKSFGRRFTYLQSAPLAVPHRLGLGLSA
jgi:hypothetical protein